MAALETRRATEAVVVHDVACHSDRSGKGPPRHADRCHLVLVRRGVFAAHVGSREHLADPCVGLVSPAGVEYRISHPGAHGDDGTVLELAPAVAEELRATRLLAIPMSSRARAATAMFEARARRAEPADLEELALDLARSVIAPPADKRGTHVTERRRIVRAAIVQLHDHLAENLPVSTLASRIGCSPFHLMRVFQRETGTTLRRYRIRLRMAAAIDRLAAGHVELATLACELGFASHAHLSDAFRREVGSSPSQLRRWLGGPRPRPMTR